MCAAGSSVTAASLLGGDKALTESSLFSPATVVQVHIFHIVIVNIRGLCLCHLNQSLRPCVECIFILSPHISMQTKYKAMRIFRHLTDTSESDLST